MKPRQIEKKLNLNKKTLANLDQKNIRGGGTATCGEDCVSAPYLCETNVVWPLSECRACPVLSDHPKECPPDLF